MAKMACQESYFLTKDLFMFATVLMIVSKIYLKSAGYLSVLKIKSILSCDVIHRSDAVK